MSTDDLHELKTYSNMKGQGRSEIIERSLKSITPALGLSAASDAVSKYARNLAVFLEARGIARILRNRDISFKEGLAKHVFFFDDAIINLTIVAGCAYVVVSNFDFALPMLGLAAIYFGSDRFIRDIEKM